jgi:hypothetical protein
MTWGGEDPASGIMTFTEDGSPGSVPIGTDGQFLSAESGFAVYKDVAVSGHNILSAIHLDTIPDVAVSGDLMFVEGSQEKWTRLPMGSSAQLIAELSGVPAWQNIEDIPGLDEISDVVNIIIESGAAVGVFSTSELATATTTSDTYTVVPGMTITPPSGDYLCSFNSSMQANKSNVKIRIGIFIDDVEILESERSSTVSSNNDPYIMSTVGIASVSGVNEISVRWRRDSSASSPTWSVFGRTFSAIKSTRNE